MKNEFNDNSKGPQNVLVPSIRDKDGMGYDIFSLLLKERIILVAGQVETAMASNIIAQLKYLEYQDRGAPITMLVNSPGGSVIDGLAIVDIMREISCPITTIGNGMQASMGSVILAAGDKRKMTKHSEVLIHQIMGGAAGGTQHSDFEISAAFMAKEHEALKSVYVEFSGLNHRFWDKVGERDTWLTAEQCKKLGFIHDVVANEKPNGPYAAYTKRPEGEENKYAKEAREAISTMSMEKVIEFLNNGNANTGEYARFRGELVVRLSEFPEFWTEGLRMERGANLLPAAAANDDSAQKTKLPRSQKLGGPKKSI